MLVRILTGLSALVIGLAAVGGPGGATYLCLMSDGAPCCCKHGDAGPRETEVRRASCCEMQESAVGHAPAAAEAPRSADVMDAAVAITEPMDLPLAPGLTGTLAPGLARGPPPGTPPTYLSNCTFLI